MATEIEPTCPSGTTLQGAMCIGNDSMVFPTCPSNYMLGRNEHGTCILKSTISNRPDCVAYYATVTDAAIVRGQAPMPPIGSEVCGSDMQLYPSWFLDVPEGSLVDQQWMFTQAAQDAAIAYKNRSTPTAAASSSAAAAAPEPTPAASSSNSDIPSYETIKSQYASYSVESDVSARMKQVTDSLKGRHVQPVPIDEVRSEILKPRTMAVIQTVLFTILLALVEFMVVPTAYAANVAFLTLCVGASAGIYLSTR